MLTFKHNKTKDKNPVLVNEFEGLKNMKNRSRRKNLFKLLKELSKIYMLLRYETAKDITNMLIIINHKFNHRIYSIYGDFELYFNPEKKERKSIFNKYNYDYIKACKFINLFVSINYEFLYLLKEGKTNQKQRLAYVLHNLPNNLIIPSKQKTANHNYEMQIYEEIEKLYLRQYNDPIFIDYHKLFLGEISLEKLNDLKIKYRFKFDTIIDYLDKSRICYEQYNEKKDMRAVISQNNVNSYSVYFQKIQISLYEELFWETFDESMFIDTLMHAKQIIQHEMSKFS